MKTTSFLFIFVILCSCSSPHPNDEQEKKIPDAKELLIPGFQNILNTAEVAGSILIYDSEKDTYYSNDFKRANQGYLPASTFKIINSIIAIETGVVNNDSTLFKWNGEKRRLKDWEQDLTLKDAFHYSCVPCYQEIARNIGVKTMTEYLDKLNYGTMKVDSTTIDLFWLEGESKITQYQQIDFLKRFYYSKLPIHSRTRNIIKRMMIIEENESYTLSGKTGWAIREGNNTGWFVGYLETPENIWFFATNIEPDQHFNMNMFPMIRKDITMKAFKQLKIIK